MKKREQLPSFDGNEEIYWDYFLARRKDPVVKSYVGHNQELSELFLKVAKTHGAKKGRFCADGSVMVTFKGVNETS